jgi:hypothetical protein
MFNELLLCSMIHFPNADAFGKLLGGQSEAAQIWGQVGACQVLSPLLGAPTKKHHGVGGLKKQTNYHTLEKKKKIWIGINFNFLFIFGFLR